MSQTKAQLIEGLNINTSAPADALAIDSSGNVGIATTSPRSTLHVAGNLTITKASNNPAIVFDEHSGSTDPKAQIQMDQTNSTNASLLFFTEGSGTLSERLRIDSSGNVGIGEISPDRLIHAKNTVDAIITKLETTNSTGRVQVNYVSPNGDWVHGIEGGNTSGDFLTYTAGSKNIKWFTGGSERMRIDSSGRLLVGTSTNLGLGEVQIPDTCIYRQGNASSTGQNVGVLKFGDTRPGEYAQIRAEADNTPGANDFPGRLLFSTTADGASSPSERVRIDSSGRVGIGDSNPDVAFSIKGSGGPVSRIQATDQSNARLRIQAGNTSESFLEFGDSDDTDVGEIVYGHSTNHMRFRTNGSERMRIDADGKLLVGLSSARANFYNSTNSPYIQLEGNDNNESALAIIQDFDAGTQGAQLVLAKNNSQTIGSNVLIDDGDQCGTVSFQGNDGTQFVEAASIIATIDGTPGANDMPGRLEFRTTADSESSPTERLRIDSNGILGVGATPDDWGGSRKAIQFSSAGAAYLCNYSTMGIASNFYFDGSSNKYLTTAAAAAVYVQNGNIHFDIAPSGTAGNSASFNTRARIDNDGLKFNGDTAAANALDDYEEGTFTPTLLQGVTNPGYTNVGGTYTKIGDCVTFTLRMRVSSGTNNSAQVLIAGLPFASSSSKREGGAFFNYRHDLNSGTAGPFMHVTQNSTRITFYNNVGGNWIGTNGSGIVNRTLHIQGQYFV